MPARVPSFLLVLALLACGGGERRGPADGGGERDVGADAPPGDGGGVADTGPRPDVPEAVCETFTGTADPLPATLLFQVDTSNSMNCAVTSSSCATGDPTPAPDDSRWDVFEAILEETLGTLPGTFRAGLMRFPGSGRACAESAPVVPIAPLETGRTALVDALGAITPDGLSTPMSDAVAYGVAQLRASGDASPYLVLATDGDNRVCLGCDTACGFAALDADNEAMIAAVGAAAAERIPTFVIGVPGAQGFRDILSRMATAAGTARSATCSDGGPEYCHYDLTDAGLDFAAALREALGEIGEAVLSCEYEIPPNPDGAFDPGKVNVRLTDDAGDETVVPRDPSRATGWDYSDDGERILLHGDTCDAARSISSGRIDIAFGCPTILI